MSTDDLKKNQRHLNGHVSMMLKFFGAGADWSHQQRLRESMLNEGISVFPLWLLFKCHKEWSAATGKLPATSVKLKQFSKVKRKLQIKGGR